MRGTVDKVEEQSGIMIVIGSCDDVAQNVHQIVHSENAIVCVCICVRSQVFIQINLFKFQCFAQYCTTLHTVDKKLARQGTSSTRNCWYIISCGGEVAVALIKLTALPVCLHALGMKPLYMCARGWMEQDEEKERKIKKNKKYKKK